ncbi:iron-containing redox enzyme family protein [Xenorhabdus budapestensis]|uniref:Iron-containing redox enzyme family protein n=1 Tax=Xenorhabdus budapestensis TaxID=290110 RepID=A0A2D0IRN7_XENBU|nr:iron-containing redox enzyme family protein [Xenorhabdus budapestensis]PHM24564.1 hypothetical protein Xbud_03272 [Xenorhabdus budapestensis]
MIVDSFSKMYKLLSESEDNGLKSLLSNNLIRDLGLINTQGNTLIESNNDFNDNLLSLENNLHKAISIPKMEKNVNCSYIDKFDVLDNLSASYAINRSFDARVSHLDSSCDYFILFELLRGLEKKSFENVVSYKFINEAISDITYFDDVFAMPAIRLAISNIKSSYQKDAIIIADLILLFFDSVKEFREAILSSEDAPSAVIFSENEDSIENKIKNIIAYKIITFFKERKSLDYIIKALDKLIKLKKSIKENLFKINLNDKNSSITMERIVSSKSSIAYGYHNNKMINKCPLDELMKKNPREFIFQLKNSHWFKGHIIEKMSFFSKLTSFNGPMYKVFTERELFLISEWAMKKNTSDSFDEDITINSSPIVNVLPPENKYKTSKNIRKFFHDLMTSDDHYYLDQKCEGFIIDWLSKAKRKINTIPFKHYDDALLHKWFLKRAKLQVEDYSQGRIVSNKSKDEIIDEAIHLAPMILLDGAWINHYSQHNLINDEIGKLLFQIYSDEIGNGYIEKNHPIIYRNLISEMGIELPDIATLEFSEFEYFDDDDFLVPVFWLSISRFPKKYLPETLGLNLAMELSGVGGAYNQARDELKKYGFNTLFVDLHNSIDNASSGHSADALNAIKIYMSKYANKNNQKLTQILWERVWTGFLSLSPPQNSSLFFFISNNYEI